MRSLRRDAASGSVLDSPGASCSLGSEAVDSEDEAAGRGSSGAWGGASLVHAPAATAEGVAGVRPISPLSAGGGARAWDESLSPLRAAMARRGTGAPAILQGPFPARQQQAVAQLQQQMRASATAAVNAAVAAPTGPAVAQASAAAAGTAPLATAEGNPVGAGRTAAGARALMSYEADEFN
jgi:hypothetical protein